MQEHHGGKGTVPRLRHRQIQFELRARDLSIGDVTFHYDFGMDTLRERQKHKCNQGDGERSQDEGRFMTVRGMKTVSVGRDNSRGNGRCRISSLRRFALPALAWRWPCAYLTD